MSRRVEEPPGRPGSRWFLAAYAGLAGFFGLEAAAREGGRTASLEASTDDQGTTRTIASAFAAAVVLAPILSRLPGPRLPRIAGPAGLAMESGGLALRGWSMRTLRTSYSRTLRTEDEQLLIDSGPYRLVRHPGYLGSLLTWIGFALASRSVPVTVLVGGLLGRAYRRRIAAEEQLLRRDLPGYAAYCDRTKALMPTWSLAHNVRMFYS